MKLTPFGKLFLALVVLGVVGFVVFKRYGDEIKSWSGAKTSTEGGKSSDNAVTKDDFNAFNGLSDAPKDGKVAVNSNNNGAIGSGKLSRPLKVAINTWAGHAPGIV